MESGRLHPGEIQTRSEPTDRQPVGERRQTGSRYGDSRSRHPPRGIEEGHVSLILEAVLDSGGGTGRVHHYRRILPIRSSRIVPLGRRGPGEEAAATPLGRFVFSY